MVNKGSVVANLIACAVGVYCCVAPSWIWIRGYSISFFSTRTVSIGTGPFIASSTTNSISSAFQWTSESVWNYYKNDITNGACSSDIKVYNSRGEIVNADTPTYFSNYFCNESDEFVLPSELKVLQAFTILATIFALFAALLSSNGRVSGGMSFLAFVFSIVSIAQAASFSYYKALLNGTAGLIFPNGSSYIILTTSGGLYWGASFYLMISIMLITLGTTVTSCKSNSEPRDEELDYEIEKEYDVEQNDPHNQPMTQPIDQQNIPTVTATQV